jgi:hypothetical protein
MNFNCGFGANVPSNESASHDHRGNIDFGLDLRAFADDEGVFALDLAFENAVDPHSPFEVELALEFCAAPEQGGDFCRRELLFHRLTAYQAEAPLGNSGLNRAARRLETLL